MALKCPFSTKMEPKWTQIEWPTDLNDEQNDDVTDYIITSFENKYFL